MDEYLKDQLDRMEAAAYDEYCDKQVLLTALTEIIDIPNRVATDARAIREIIKLATEAIERVESKHIA